MQTGFSLVGDFYQFITISLHGKSTLSLSHGLMNFEQMGCLPTEQQDKQCQ